MDQEDLCGLSKDMQIEKLMTRFGEELKRLTYTYVKDHATAEDVTQEIFLKVFLKLDTYEGKSSIRTWIYSIAINTCKDYLRSWHVRKIAVQQNLTDLLTAKQNGPEQDVELHAERRQLVHEVLQLHVKYREVILLYYYRELSVKEISEILAIHESAVKVRLHRGREKLREPLELLERGEANG